LDGLGHKGFIGMLSAASCSTIILNVGRYTKIMAFIAFRKVIAHTTHYQVLTSEIN